MPCDLLSNPTVTKRTQVRLGWDAFRLQNDHKIPEFNYLGVVQHIWQHATGKFAKPGKLVQLNLDFLR
jgi:hypothetical protein